MQTALNTAPKNKTALNVTLNNNKKCSYCNIIFTRNSSVIRHEKICKIKIEMENKIIELEHKVNNTNLIKQNDELITQKNNMEIKNNNIQLNDNKIINNGVINNNTTINYIINSVGCENIEKLTFEDIKKIFRQHKNCLYHAIDFVNFNENMPENHNFYNSSLEGKYINVFNAETNSPEKKNKKDFFDKLLMSSLNIMNLLYEKVKDSVSPIKKKSLKKMINELDKIAHLDNHKKIYAINVNQISYNKKEIVKKTWNEYTKNNKNNENYDSDIESNNNRYIDSESDTESKDSFYYLTEEDSESEPENNSEDD
jgi:hypothetical protein